MDLGEIECGDMDRTDLAQAKDKWMILVNMARNLRVA
jgi:hypothetical protein